MGRLDPQNSSAEPLTAELQVLASRMAGRLRWSELQEKPLVIRRGPQGPDQPQAQQQEGQL